MSKPLFMWAGGKNKMLKKYEPHMPKKVENYCEPFFGGGAMFVHTKTKYNPTGTIILNDINSDLMNIYIAIKDSRKEFQTRLDFLERQYIPKDKPARKKYYYEVRKEHSFQYQNWSKAEEAATLYFLMKTGFNGVYQINKNTNGRYGTASGLLNQKQHVYDRNVLDWWEKNLQGVILMSDKWKVATSRMPVGLPNTFYFLDPPYRDSFADYGNSFDDKELTKLVRFADSQDSVFLSNRETGDGWFEKHKGSLSLAKFPVTYTAGRRKQNADGSFAAKKATEILLYR